MGNYPPSSTFKLVVAATLLETLYNNYSPYPGYWNERDIFEYTLDKEINCRGGRYIGRDWFGCNKVHGHVNLRSAISESCNTYFYTLGLELGWDAVYVMAKRFGLGNETQIDFGYESSGLLPDKRWKSETLDSPWYDGNTAHACIGQGYLLFTPIQVNNIASAIATGGTIYKPHIVKEVFDPETSEVNDRTSPEVLSENIMCDQTVNYLQDSMRSVVVEGTAYYARMSRVAPIAGKTGTAENPDGEPHAWFTCYAPYTGTYSRAGQEPIELDPEIASADPIAVTVFLEHGGSGGFAAAPIATAIIKYIFERNQDRQRMTSEEIVAEVNEILTKTEKEMGLTIFIPTEADIRESFIQDIEERRKEQAARQRELVRQYEQETLELIQDTIREETQVFERQITHSDNNNSPSTTSSSPNNRSNERNNQNRQTNQSTPSAQSSQSSQSTQTAQSTQTSDASAQSNQSQQDQSSRPSTTQSSNSNNSSQSDSSANQSSSSQQNSQSQSSEDTISTNQSSSTTAIQTESQSTQQTSSQSSNSQQSTSQPSNQSESQTQSSSTTSTQDTSSSRDNSSSTESSREANTISNTRTERPIPDRGQIHIQSSSAQARNNTQRNAQTSDQESSSESLESIESEINTINQNRSHLEEQLEEEMKQEEQRAKERMERAMQQAQQRERQQEREQAQRAQQEENLPENIRRLNQQQQSRNSQEMREFLQQRRQSEEQNAELRSFIEEETRRLQNRMNTYDKEE